MQKATTILKPLKRISPSRYTALKKCPFRVVLSNSCPSPLLPYPPSNHLGNVIHECISLIITGKIRTSADFDDAWNCLLTKEERSLEDMGFAFFTPLSENVPGYAIKKLQVKTLLESRGKAEVQEDKKTDIITLTEKWLEAQDSMIGGYVDIIINKKDYIKLSDFKSGKILLEEGEIKEEYEEQLKLYAYLHNEVYGKYPDELSIIDLDKKEYSVTFTPQECDALATKSREVLSKINSLIEMNDLETLAKPDLNTCKSCLYRPACNFYWNLPLSNASNSIFRDIKGYVAGVKQFSNGNINAILYKGDRKLIVSHINSDFLPFLSNIIGKEVAFYNIKQVGIQDRYQAIKTTKVYEL